MGGFGDSEYLRQAVKNTFGSNEKMTITVPSNPLVYSPPFSTSKGTLIVYFRQSAIVQGAALRGLHGIRASARRCRRNYGFSWNIPFRKGIDDEKNSRWDRFLGKKMVPGIMKWMIKKVQ